MLKALMRNAGIRPARILAACRGWRRYAANRADFRARLSGSDFAWGREFPILTEMSESNGSVTPYLLQDLTVARWVREDDPARHVDVGSRIDGFITHLAVFREIEAIDIRPGPGTIPGVVFRQLDLMEELPSEWVENAPSVSCLHTVEHFGLGRYGDPIDPVGHEKGIARLKEMVAPGGMLYLSTPIGTQRIEFNAHRIFAAATLFGWFGDGWEIERFALIDDETRLHGDVAANAAGISGNFGCECGVGILAVRKV